jgi:2-polyprenyl-3-methyl-5-hydroxy-6-metoxy-1,4-benzoquinol methylase
MLDRQGLQIIETRGLNFRPTQGFVLSQDLSLNYLVAAVGAKQ